MAILAAWTVVHLRVSAIRPARVVIQHGATDYLAPDHGHVHRQACRADPEVEESVRPAVRAQGSGADRARKTVVESDDEVVARFRGTYVAVATDDEPER